jgi:hypothetical protein
LMEVAHVARATHTMNRSGTDCVAFWTFDF